MNKVNSSMLNECILKLKKGFPCFEYINNLTALDNTCNLGKETNAIIVRGINRKLIKKFMDYVEQQIFIPLIASDLELPNIILLEKYSVQGLWKYFSDCNEISDDSKSTVLYISAEDYNYLMAA